MTTSIVIPVYGRWDLLHQLLQDLYNNCSLIEEIVVVDNGNAGKYQDVIGGLAWWKKSNMLPIEVISLEENVGFLKASNIGLKHAVEDVKILISTDVRVHKDIVQYSLTISNSLLGGRLIDWDSGWNTIGNKTYPYIEGYILCANKEDWEEIGYFDERFAPNDMEDVNVSATASALGMGLFVYPEGYVSHVGAQTLGYGEERENTTKINKKKFEEKWG